MSAPLNRDDVKDEERVGVDALARALGNTELDGRSVWFVQSDDVPDGDIGGLGEAEVAALVLAELTPGERFAIAGITEDRLAAALVAAQIAPHMTVDDWRPPATRILAALQEPTP